MTDKYKILATGERAKVDAFLFTTAILVGGSNSEHDYYRTRFCYEHANEAVAALDAWDGNGDPPGNWIVQKPEGRYNRLHED